MQLCLPTLRMLVSIRTTVPYTTHGLLTTHRLPWVTYTTQGLLTLHLHSPVKFHNINGKRLQSQPGRRAGSSPQTLTLQFPPSPVSLSVRVPSRKSDKASFVYPPQSCLRAGRHTARRLCLMTSRMSRSISSAAFTPWILATGFTITKATARPGIRLSVSSGLAASQRCGGLGLPSTSGIMLLKSCATTPRTIESSQPCGS